MPSLRISLMNSYHSNLHVFTSKKSRYLTGYLINSYWSTCIGSWSYQFVVKIWTGCWWMVAIFFVFPEILGLCHHPNWRSHIFQRGGPGPPTSKCSTHFPVISLFHVSGRSPLWRQIVGRSRACVLPWTPHLPGVEKKWGHRKNISTVFPDSPVSSMIFAMKPELDILNHLQSQNS